MDEIMASPPFTSTASRSGATPDDRLEAAIQEARASRGEQTGTGGGRGRLSYRTPTDMPSVGTGSVQGERRPSASRGAGRTVPPSKVPTYHMAVGDTSSEDQGTGKAKQRVTSVSAPRGAGAQEKTAKSIRPGFLDEEELAALAGVTKQVGAKCAERSTDPPSAGIGAGAASSADIGAAAGVWAGAFKGTGEKLSAASGAGPPVTSTRQSQRSQERGVGSKESPQRARTRSRGSEASDAGYDTGRSKSRRASKSVTRVRVASPPVEPPVAPGGDRAHISRDEVLLLGRRIEELEEKEHWLNEANVHFAQRVKEAEERAGSLETQGRELYANHQAVLKESVERLGRLREAERAYETSQNDLAVLGERIRTREAEMDAFRAHAEAKTIEICMDAEKKFTAKLREKGGPSGEPWRQMCDQGSRGHRPSGRNLGHEQGRACLRAEPV